jgi:putative membrane protein
MRKKPLLIMTKGLCVGGTMLIPGVSGGSMAMVLGIYDQLVSSVSSFVKRENFFFLGQFLIGSVLGMIIFARPLLMLMEHYPLPMSYFFIGLVAGSIPMIYQKAAIRKFSGRIIYYPAIGAAFVLLISALPADAFKFNAEAGIVYFLHLAAVGAIAAVALVLPGISVSYMLLLVGMYDETMKAISELFLPLIVLSILLLLALNIPDVELMHLRPSLSRGIEPYVRAIPRLFLVYLGYEVVYFLLPFMREPKKVMIAGIAGVSIPIFIYTMLVFTALTVFGVKPTSTMMYPTVILARRLLFPGAFAERFDIFFIIFWILAAFTTLGIFLYLSSIASTRLLGLRNYKPFSLLIAPFVYQIAILPQNVNHIDQLAMAAGYTGAAVVGASVPLWIVAVLRKKGGKQRA